MENLDYKTLSIEKLNEQLVLAEANHQDLRYKHNVSALQNPNELVIAKRNIARIKTELRARELDGSTEGRERIVKRRRLQKSKK